VGVIRLLRWNTRGSNVDKRPRGERGCNPGNIRKGADWKGMRPVQTDPSFVQFTTMAYGVRAAAIILMNYAAKYRGRNGTPIDTVEEVIERWAPYTENQTKSYIEAVAKALGVTPRTTIEIRRRSVMLPLLYAIFRHENGSDVVSASDMNTGLDLAGVEE
jgi:hypothetical protein